MSDPRDEMTERPEDHDLPRRRPWGPASFWRSGLVLLAIVIAVLLATQFS
jgi:hypothetical protein